MTTTRSTLLADTRSAFRWIRANADVFFPVCATVGVLVAVWVVGA